MKFASEWAQRNNGARSTVSIEADEVTKECITWLQPAEALLSHSVTVERRPTWCRVTAMLQCNSCGKKQTNDITQFVCWGNLSWEKLENIIYWHLWQQYFDFAYIFKLGVQSKGNPAKPIFTTAKHKIFVCHDDFPNALTSVRPRLRRLPTCVPIQVVSPLQEQKMLPEFRVSVIAFCCFSSYSQDLVFHVWKLSHVPSLSSILDLSQTHPSLFALILQRSNWR